MAPEKVTPIQWTPDHVEAFGPVALRNPWGALEQPGEIMHGCYLFDVQHGRQHALMAVRRQEVSGGVRAEITGLVSAAPFFHCEALDAAAMMAAHQLGADVLGMSTQVPALARACHRHGWATTGAILTKWMREQH